jgi:hypothetical protein
MTNLLKPGKTNLHLTVGLAAVLGFEKRPARNRSCHEKLQMKLRTKVEQ